MTDCTHTKFPGIVDCSTALLAARKEVMKLQTDLATTRAAYAQQNLLGETRTGMRISCEGILGRIANGRYYKELNYGCGEMLKHLQEMAKRFYAGDPRAVDEFLQLYDLDDDRLKGQVNEQ